MINIYNYYIMSEIIHSHNDIFMINIYNHYIMIKITLIIMTFL